MVREGGIVWENERDRERKGLRNASGGSRSLCGLLAGNDNTRLPASLRCPMEKRRKKSENDEVVLERRKTEKEERPRERRESRHEFRTRRE